jgi:hypothetical protein
VTWENTKTRKTTIKKLEPAPTDAFSRKLTADSTIENELQSPKK